MTQPDASTIRIAMRYAIPLAEGQPDLVRNRVAEIGPSFNALPGLVAKLFLLADDQEPTYSLFYIWDSPAAMHAFLDGDRFASVVAKYGRPEVTAFLTGDASAGVAQGDRVAVLTAPAPGTVAANRFEDPATGGSVLLVKSPTGRHEVLFVARPAT